jgi:hypothetical protein
MGGTTMQWQERVQRARAEWMLLTFYERFEQIIILILTGLIAIVIVSAVWNLTLKIFHGVIAPQTFDPSEYSVFQAVFGRSSLSSSRSSSNAPSLWSRNGRKASCRSAPWC